MTEEQGHEGDEGHRGDADARLAIANDLDDTLIVEAAAGTGKTTELVNRILQVLATGRATMVRDCRGHVYGEGGGRAEAPAARGARARARQGDRPAGLRPARRGARDARGSARQYHPRLLRRAAARAPGRSASRSVVCRPDRAAGGSRLRTRVPRMASGSAEGAARRTSARAAAEQWTVVRGGGEGGGPIDRLRGAGRTLAEARDFPHPWDRPAVRSRRGNRSPGRRAPPLRGTHGRRRCRRVTTSSSTPPGRAGSVCRFSSSSRSARSISMAGKRGSSI